MNPAEAQSTASTESLLGRVADEYTRRLNEGQTPDIEEYAARYPGIAALIRQVFPAIGALHEVGAGSAASADNDTARANLTGCLGDYRIVREIGRGGMGIVYEAEQISLARRVALKILPFAAVLDGKQLQRFKNEAQAAAQLHHTNIVPVFAVGCERGVHYYAMQYIEGQSLAEAIRDLRSLAQIRDLEAVEAPSGGHPSPPITATEVGPHRTSEIDVPNAPRDVENSADSDAGRPSTSPRAYNSPGSSMVDVFTSKGSTRTREYFRAVANLGVEVANALDHAHELGVIHRDIKPSNLLLDLRGHVWITDFGLARVQSDPGLTLTGDLLGTLRYMSPEQALARRAAVDHRTDIYSLGLTLYELLTLQPAFNGTDRHELLRQIAFVEPRPARRLNDAVPHELETILVKASSKNPAERYATAGELADDLRRFLEDKPIQARCPTILQRAAKWSRRHRPIVATAGVVLMVAVIGLSIGSWLLWQEQDRTKAAYEQARANEAKAVAEAERADREARDAGAQAAKAEQVGKFLQEMLAAVNPETAQSRDTTLLREILDKAAARIETELADQPEAEAAIRTTIGMTYRALGLYAEAETHLRKGLEIRLALFGEEHKWTLQSLTELSILYHTTGRFAEAEPLAIRTLALLRRDYGDEHVLTLRGMQNLGVAYWALGKYAQAEPLLVRVIDAYRRAPNDQDRGPFIAMSGLAAVYEATGRGPQAEPLHLEAIAGLCRVLGEQHPDTLVVMSDLARMYREQGRLAEAERLSSEVLEGQRRVLGPEHTHTLTSMVRLAQVYVEQGRNADAEPILHQVLDIRRRSLGDEHPQTLMALTCLALSLRSQGRLAESEPLFVESLAGWRQARGDLHKDTANALSNLGNLYRDLKRFDEAEPLLREALDVRRKLLGNNHPAVAATLNDLATLYQDKGDHAAAEPFLREGLAIQRRTLPAGDPGISGGLALLGSSLLTQRKYADAQPVLRECLEIRTNAFPDGHPQAWLRFNVMSMLGESLLGQNRFQEAEPLLLEAYEKMQPPPGPITGKRKHEALERIVKLYESWDAAEPDQGYDAKAAQWRAELEEQATQPRSEEE